MAVHRGGSVNRRDGRLQCARGAGYFSPPATQMRALSATNDTGATMPANFVIFCEARTGSYNLTSRLDSCPDIVCHGEIFKRDKIELRRHHREKITTQNVAQRNADPLAFFEQIRRLNPYKIVGFKLFNHHMHWAPKLGQHITKPETKRVILWRDPIEIYASGLRAAKSGQWTQRKHKEAKPHKEDVTVTHEPEKFRKFVAHYNKYTVAASMLAGISNSFVIYYSQTNDPDVLDNLLQFLGSETKGDRTETNFVKQYTGTHDSEFTNWRDLQDQLLLTNLADAPNPSVPLH